MRPGRRVLLALGATLRNASDLLSSHLAWIAWIPRTMLKLEDMAYEIPVTQARAELADLINRVVYGGERVVVTRHGKPLAALVSAADLRRLEEEQDTVEEPVISAISTVRTVPPAAREPRFGIAAEHRSPDAR
jgi:prevent-host-death family protein